MFKKIIIVLASVTLAMMGVRPVNATSWTSNLLVNFGAEKGDLTGWTVINDSEGGPVDAITIDVMAWGPYTGSYMFGSDKTTQTSSIDEWWMTQRVSIYGGQHIKGSVMFITDSIDVGRLVISENNSDGWNILYDSDYHNSNHIWSEYSFGPITLDSTTSEVEFKVGARKISGYGCDVAFDTANLQESVPITKPCEGDFDYDGDVDGSDLAIIASDFGRTDCEAKILGTWIGDEDNGLADSWGFFFHCDRLDIVGPQEWYRGKFLLNKAVNPYQIDFFITASHNEADIGKTSLGIYQIEGKILSIAINQPGITGRPTSFTPNGTRIFHLSK